MGLVVVEGVEDGAVGRRALAAAGGGERVERGPHPFEVTDLARDVVDLGEGELADLGGLAVGVGAAVTYTLVFLP